MEYLNVTTAFLRSAEYLGAEPIDRGTWLNLAGYCALMENGGTILGCRQWKDRRCQQILGITRAEMLRDCDLWSWQGEDLSVHYYPAEQEAKVIRKRGIARHNGNLGGRPPKTNLGFPSDTGSEPISVPDSPPTSEPISESVKERKGREGKEKGEREPAAAPDPAAGNPDPLALTAQRIVDAYPRRERWSEAIAIVYQHLTAGADPSAMLAGTQAAAAFLRTAPAGPANKYAPSALRFFESRRWLDDPTTLIRPPAGKHAPADSDILRELGGRSEFLDQHPAHS